MKKKQKKLANILYKNHKCTHPVSSPNIQPHSMMPSYKSTIMLLSSMDFRHGISLCFLVCVPITPSRVCMFCNELMMCLSSPLIALCICMSVFTVNMTFYCICDKNTSETEAERWIWFTPQTVDSNHCNTWKMLAGMKILRFFSVMQNFTGIK